MMPQEGSAFRLGFKGSGFQNPRLHHMPSRRNRKRYGQVWGLPLLSTLGLDLL
jgi:hypothetical protein